MATTKVKIGNAGGYWGDDLGALLRQVEGGDLDYVGLDFLAEITMSIMQKQRNRDPSAGFARDFVDQMREVWPVAAAKGTKVLTNAGGVNPRGLGEALVALARKLKIDAHVGVVTGDDLMGQLDELAPHLANMDTGEPFSKIAGRVSAANAYFGAAPLVAALEGGADVIVTGRCTDTALVMAPLMHAFGWARDDWDKLAHAVVGGHILECGAQSTGGNSTDWRQVRNLDKIGYPVLVGRPDGRFTITKHARTGGEVSVGTVSEQLVYEMGDPATYITPDVTADFRTIQLEAGGTNKVKVSGITGRPPPDQLKVSIAFEDGWKASGAVIISGPDAVEKSRAFAEIFWKRLPYEFEGTSTELIGHSACHRHMAPRVDPPEVYLRFGVRDADRGKVTEFGKLLPSLILSGPPGVSIVGGRPKPQQILGYWPALVPREAVSMEVEVLHSGRRKPKHMVIEQPPAPGPGAPSRAPAPALPAAPPKGRTRKVRLSKIARGRSGDKGDTCNIGIVARSPLAYAWLRRYLTASKIKRWFGDLVLGPVTRHEVPNLLALNFLCDQALDGGGTRSLRIDAQGKTFAWAVLGREVEVPLSVLRSCAPVDARHPGSHRPRRTGSR